MKKIFWIAAAVAGLFAAASCQKENASASGDVNVSLTVALPEALSTKAMSQADMVDVVYYEVWNADWSKQLYPVDNSTLASETVSNKQATINLSLVADQTYNFIFWACNAACNAYDVSELKNVKVNYTTLATQGNQDKFDAFYAVKDIHVTGPIKETIKLYRPFAQLNFASSQMNSSFGEIKIGTTSVSVSRLATAFDTINGKGHTAAAAPVIFQAEGLATDEKLSTNGTTYTWVTMDYMFMMDEKSNVDITAKFEVEGIGIVEHSIPSVNIQRNYRTNIIGPLFTADAALTIEVVPGFKPEDENITVPDNK